MVLNFPGIPNPLFPQARRDGEGIATIQEKIWKIWRASTGQRDIIQPSDKVREGSPLGILDLNMLNARIINVQNPLNAQEAATKNYVDGKVAILKGTHYLSIPACAFTSVFPDVDDVVITNPHSQSDASHAFISTQAGKQPMAPVFLPHGAIVTGVVVYGNAGATAEDWELCRVTLSNSTALTMATAKIGSQDTTISNATINNASYTYVFCVDNLDLNDEIWGARITYTL